MSQVQLPNVKGADFELAFSFKQDSYKKSASSFNSHSKAEVLLSELLFGTNVMQEASI